MLHDYTKRFFENRNWITEVSEREIIDAFRCRLCDTGFHNTFFKADPRTVGEMMDIINLEARTQEAAQA